MAETGIIVKGAHSDGKCERDAIRCLRPPLLPMDGGALSEPVRRILRTTEQRLGRDLVQGLAC